LKDGTFHIVRSYERKGERVRYYSLERSAWEEIPAELVNWEATRRAEAETKAEKQALIEKMEAAERARLAGEIDVDASIEVAPGLFLPDDEGIFVLQDNAVLPLTQAGTEVKRSKGRLLVQVLVPVVPSRHKVEIPGQHATLRITTPTPEFYFRTADAREPNMVLIRAKVKGDSREVQVIDTDVVGQQSTQQEVISTQRWEVARGVFRYTMGQQLEPGEYALAEFISGQGMNLYVWDFGVDPAPTPRDAGKQRPEGP